MKLAYEVLHYIPSNDSDIMIALKFIMMTHLIL